ncbi:glycosyltransferase [Bacillus sp. M6-12]|uniref:WecB/TagA/CpsF family glycosyltransferase n=1 Tax=Bacillus sp. M6-12 TaxID=2054166 RepID=UPI000C775F60|nr:WecB/TagA/CpsF family glycosyltransferase [Bacillus sp. M6-12]PLS18659.1 glycosyltransferase [Bacillus sp. M6-12]
MKSSFFNEYPFYQKDFETLLADAIGKIANKEKHFIVTANPEILMNAYRNDRYRSALLSANDIVADGIGVVWASKLLHTPSPAHIPGIDIMQQLINKASDKQFKVYMLGSKPESLENAVSNLKQSYPNLLICGYHHGYFQDSEKILKKIKAAEPDIVFVALGSPMQEQWIYENFPFFDKGLFIGIGGSFDILSGQVKRAPLSLRKAHLEWAYRLLIHPRRMNKAKNLFVFSILILYSKLTSFLSLNKNSPSHSPD